MLSSIHLKTLESSTDWLSADNAVFNNANATGFDFSQLSVHLHYPYQLE